MGRNLFTRRLADHVASRPTAGERHRRRADHVDAELERRRHDVRTMPGTGPSQFR